MDSFDKHIQEQAGNFGKPPREHVWQRISDELDAKKKRRLAFWLWWLVPVFLAGGGFLYFANMKQQPKATYAATTHDTLIIAENIQPNNNQKPATAITVDSLAVAAKPDKTAMDVSANISKPTSQDVIISNTAKAAVNTRKISSLQQGTLLKTNKPKTTSVIVDQWVHTPTPTLSTPLLLDTTILLQPNDEAVRLNTAIEVDILKPEMQATIQENKQVDFALNPLAYPPIAADHLFADSLAFLGQQVALSMQSIEKALATNTLEASENLLDTKPSPTNKAANPKNNKASWNIVAGLGTHNLTSKPLGLKTSVAEFNSFNPTNPTGGQSSSILQPTKPGAGFMLGIERLQPIAKAPRWNWLAGMHYQYQSLHFATGSRSDSSLQFADASNSRSSTAAYFFRPGSTQRQTGHQHRVMLQAGLQWKLHKNGKWLVQGSTFAGLNVQHKYWIPQSRNIGWVPSEGLVSRGFAGIETGFAFRPAKWGLGIYGQYTFTPVSNFTTLPKQYWRGVELRFHYTIFQNTSN